jgi:hypothetical protein
LRLHKLHTCLSITLYFERWHHKGYDTVAGYSITKDENYASPTFNHDDFAVLQVFYDNPRETLYAITDTKLSRHLDISTITTDSANMTVSTKVSTLDFECFNVLTWFGYDDNTHTFVVLGYCTTEKKNYILRMSIDTGKIASKVATTINRDFYRDYFFDTTGTILHVVNTNNPYNGTFTTYTLDLKTGVVDKPIVIWDPATEHVLASQWEQLCYNPVDNTMLMSAMVEGFDGKWQINFVVTDLKTGERKSHAKVGFIDIKKIVWI